ncbi:TonB-dependent receptor domain-containing protein [Flectobacillus major]|jgi:outer membrane receptor protein involved in Fe transport|uniref:TonB-dependent receptor domain-containing protein n=1 Tax=Flectobacillus major TaxID=103 RepID=UPI0004203D37|nr:TonB-dependent receptor [Flectobacillus major]
MKKFLLLSALSLVGFNLWAQFPGVPGMGGGQNRQQQAIPGTAQAAPKGSAKIVGYVIDSAATKAVEFASVALINKTTNKPVDGTVADEKGKFTLAKVATGEYIVSVSFLGYQSKKMTVNIVNKNDEIDLGVIRLSQSTQLLQEVTVEGQKAVIEDKVDRLVYNAERDATSRGGDASDVLRKVPMLSVDLDGNVSLRGSSNVRVLINNKPSTIVATSVADALKQIPADMIKTVEVITSPSAKYDAEGSSGIINIITKKNTLQGLTLNLDSSVGIRGGNLSLNGNYRKKNMGFSLGGFGRANYNINGTFENQQITTANNIQTINKQFADTRSNGMFGSYQLGWDWDINKHNSVTASVRYGVRNQRNYQDGLLNERFSGTTLLSQNLRDVDVKDLSGTIDANIDYTHTFKKPQQEFSLLTQFSRNNRTNDFINNNLNISDLSILSRLKNNNDSYNQEVTVQADYQTPLSKTQLVEIGAKGIFRTVNSDYKYFSAQGATGEYTELNNSLASSNVFSYNQNIVAGYLSYTATLSKKYTLKVGGRYEHTDINANFKTGETSLSIPSYGVLVPSLNISRKLKGASTLKFAYNRRIQRPSIQFLNPNVNASNPLSISSGNPNLSPEYTNNYELTLNTTVKSTFLTVATFVRNTTGSIESVRDVKGDTIRTNFQNIGNQDAYGMNAFANVSLSNKLMIGLGGDVYYAKLNNNVANPLYNASNSGWVANYRIFGSYNLGNNWGVQAFGFYRSTQVQLQGFQGGFGIYSLSLKKDFKDKKGSIGFGAENFFTPNGFKINNEINSPIIAQNSTTTLRNMNFKVNFSYRIGKMSFDAPSKRKKSVNNDDLKEGGEGGGGGQQQGGATPAAGGGRPR